MRARGGPGPDEAATTERESLLSGPAFDRIVAAVAQPGDPVAAEPSAPVDDIVTIFPACARGCLCRGSLPGASTGTSTLDIAAFDICTTEAHHTP